MVVVLMQSFQDYLNSRYDLFGTELEDKMLENDIKKTYTITF